MLNPKTNTRELAYIVKIDAIEPIQGSDNCECAIVGGWRVMVRKNEFKVGDPAIYFEIDSYLDPSNPAFAFMEKKKYKVKTQRYTFGGKGNFVSQGLLISAAAMGWTTGTVPFDTGEVAFIRDETNTLHFVDDDSRFLTEKIGVTYSVAEDNKRKANNSSDKYKRMAQRNEKLFSHQPFRWLMKRDWGKRLLFFFFGKKNDNRSWPAWVKKTDEERVQNMIWILEDKNPWIATEKIDGTSTTFTLKKSNNPFKKDDFYICSRNVVFDTPDKKCFYENNVYTEMAEKYNIYNIMSKLLHGPFNDCEWITIQGETYGNGIQKRDYHAPEHGFMAFNFIDSKNGRWNSIQMRTLLEKEGIPCVPIVNEEYYLPDTIEELTKFVDSETSVLDGGMREGIVFRSIDGSRSFKCVSPDYLIKYHG